MCDIQGDLVIISSASHCKMSQNQLTKWHLEDAELTLSIGFALINAIMYYPFTLVSKPLVTFKVHLLLTVDFECQY